jgi:hypothetical protein
VAQDLERSADRAKARGGVASAAAFLELAAQLTPDHARTASRALVAARGKFEAGDHEAASRLLTVTEKHSHDELEIAMVGALRARVAFQATRGDGAAAQLLRAAVGFASLDDAQAREMFMEAFAAAMYVGRFSSAGGMTEVAKAARGSVRVPSPADPIDLLLEALTARQIDGYVLAAPALRRAVDAFVAEADPAPATLRWMWMAMRRRWSPRCTRSSGPWAARASFTLMPRSSPGAASANAACHCWSPADAKPRPAARDAR